MSLEFFGMMTLPFETTSEVVLATTSSPCLHFFESKDLSKTAGTFVPEGICKSPVLAEALCDAVSEVLALAFLPAFTS